MFKKIWNWFIEIIKETLNLSWTLVGLVIATLTLTGSAQQITGLATLITLVIWLLTIGFRKVRMMSKKQQVVDSKCLSYKNEKGTNVTICNCLYPKR